MRSGTIPLAIFFGLFVLGGIVWFGRVSALPVDEAVNPPPVSPDLMLKLSPTGPYPKVDVPELEYDFGVMEVAEERAHTFVIRNEGDAPLILKKGKTTCKCTVSDLPEDHVPVGGSVEVELKWKPIALSETFQQRATIHTNDPKNREINFTVRGRVQDVVVMSPANGWNVRDISDKTPTERTGVLYSAILDEFKVLGIESSHKLLTAEATPLREEELKNLNAKSGYSIRATLAPGIEAGGFRLQLTIRTDVRDKTNFVVYLTGNRPGPISILPMAGVIWHGAAHILELGQLNSREGRKAELLLYVSGLGEKELEFVDVQTNPKFLKVTLTPDLNLRAATKKRYRLTFEVPPGSPPGSWVRGSSAKVTVKTNHPEVDTLEFFVRFVSLRSE